MSEPVASGRFVGSTAVITGAGSGIGRATALALAHEGAQVTGVGRHREKLDNVALESMGASGRIGSREADLTKDDSIRALVDELRVTGDLDILVHSAGVHSVGDMTSTPVVELDRHYRTNVRAPYLLTQLLLPMLVRASGQIVFVNSSAVRRAVAGIGPYAATKHALRGLADVAREELNSSGIRVLSVYPGRTAGAMQEALHDHEGRPYRPELLLQPEDVATSILDALALPRTAELTELDIRPMHKS